MIYVIDASPRARHWRQALPDAHLVPRGGYDMPELGPADIVFAHTPTDFDHRVAHDDLSTGTEELRRIKDFRHAMIVAARDGRAPYLVLYSGDRIAETRQAWWKERTRTHALPDYPADRIDVIEVGISRDVNADALVRLVDAAKRSNAPANSNRHEDLRSGTSVSGEVEKVLRSEEAALALRLLCEAWELVHGGPEAGRSGVAVCAPGSPADWFSPFGHQPSTSAAGEIAAIIGTDGVAANLLRAAADGDDLAEPVAAFLAASKNARR